MKYLNQLKQLDKDQEKEGIMNWKLKAEIEGLEEFKALGETLEELGVWCACGNRKMEESEFCKECI